MKFTLPVITAVVLSPIVGAFVVKAPSAKPFSTALPYRINENEEFELDQIISPQNFGYGRSSVAPPVPEQTEQAIAPRRFKRSGGAVQEAIQSLWSTTTPKNIQGNCLKTWTVQNHQVERVQILLKNDGYPLKADVSMWQGPENTPQKIRFFSEDGKEHPFSAVLKVASYHNSVAIKNTAELEFPMGACVVADIEDVMAGGDGSAGSGAVVKDLAEWGKSHNLNGDSTESFHFSHTVESVQVLLRTDGRPMHARIELQSGPSHSVQTIDIYSENGLDFPFFAVIDTPADSSTIRVVNTGPMTFPMSAIVEPYMVDEDYTPPVKETPRGKVDTSNDLFFIK
jgi:hypothetical protein